MTDEAFIGPEASPESTDPTVDTGNVSPDEYSTQGKTRLATRRGYRFAPSNKDLPVITSEGVNMTREHADQVLAEAASLRGRRGLVFEVTEEGE